MHLLLSAVRLASPPLSYRRHASAMHIRKLTIARARVRTHASARYTCVRTRLCARASALMQAHDSRAYSRLRALATSQTVECALFTSTHASARYTCVRSRLCARASALMQAHDSRAYSRLRARATSQTVECALFTSHSRHRR